MNITRLPAKFIIVLFSLATFGYEKVSAQNRGSVETSENLYQHWFNALDAVQKNNGATRKDFEVFTRFSSKALDSLRGDFLIQIGEKKVNLTNVEQFESVLVSSINSLYKKYQAIKLQYPSSVEEFRNQRQPYLTSSCDSACNNIDFENGTLSGWNAYYAVNESNTLATTIADITGGPAGAVTLAANDTLTSTPGYYNAGSVGPNPRPDYQIRITSGTRGDAIIPSIPVVSPFGGHYSVMLGDSTEVNYGAAILSQTFLVGASNENFTYQYAVFLANPKHNYYEQPFFRVAVINAAGDTVPYCGEYNVISGNGTQKFDSTIYHATYPDGDTGSFIVYYKNWTIVNVPLTRYVGQCITVVFEISDCGLGGHFGYAYIDASCAPLAVISSSQNFCGQDSIILTGPAGESHYLWTGPAAGIRGSDTTQQISVDSAGTYTLVVTPFTGATCSDTLTISIGKVPGPPPHPSFKADTGCAGLPIAFTNLSHPISGASFYWDFYNTGTYEDSAVNPTWIYNLPGIYTVKLEEIYNGCGMDTTVKVIIDTTVSSSFYADTVCFSDTTKFTNTTTGALSYYWNFGDTRSGINNTSTLQNPIHRFDSSGSFIVALIGKHLGWCNDTFKLTVIVLPPPKINITGVDSLCSGSSTVIAATGGGTYIWSNGSTLSSITVSPTVKTTYTVAISNGICTLDTLITIPVKPLGTGTLTGNGLVCFGDSVVLTATGGGTYLWSTGATTSSITVVANSKSDSLYSVSISNAGSCITLHKSINIDSLIGFACCDTTIYSGDSVIISGSGGIHYYWQPPSGLNCDTCTHPLVNPTVTTTYTLISTDANGCTARSAITITVDIPCYDVFVPNVFTPNGDGRNDTYLIKVEFMSDYEIWIYNRWGKMVFHSTNPDAPWDGTINGDKASDGVYYYILKTTCQTGKSNEKHGYLQLIR